MVKSCFRGQRVLRVEEVIVMVMFLRLFLRLRRSYRRYFGRSAIPNLRTRFQRWKKQEEPSRSLQSFGGFWPLLHFLLSLVMFSCILSQVSGAPMTQSGTGSNGQTIESGWFDPGIEIVIPKRVPHYANINRGEFLTTAHHSSPIECKPFSSRTEYRTGSINPCDTVGPYIFLSDAAGPIRVFNLHRLFRDKFSKRNVYYSDCQYNITTKIMNAKMSSNCFKDTPGHREICQLDLLDCSAPNSPNTHCYCPLTIGAGVVRPFGTTKFLFNSTDGCCCFQMKRKIQDCGIKEIKSPCKAQLKGDIVSVETSPGTIIHIYSDLESQKAYCPDGKCSYFIKHDRTLTVKCANGNSVDLSRLDIKEHSSNIYKDGILGYFSESKASVFVSNVTYRPNLFIILVILSVLSPLILPLIIAPVILLVRLVYTRLKLARSLKKTKTGVCTICKNDIFCQDVIEHEESCKDSICSVCGRVVLNKREHYKLCLRDVATGRKTLEMSSLNDGSRQISVDSNEQLDCLIKVLNESQESSTAWRLFRKAAVTTYAVSTAVKTSWFLTLFLLMVYCTVPAHGSVMGVVDIESHFLPIDSSASQTLENFDVVSRTSTFDLIMKAIPKTGKTYILTSPDSNETESVSIILSDWYAVYDTELQYFTSDREIKTSMDVKCTDTCSEKGCIGKSACKFKMFRRDRGWGCNPASCWSSGTGCTECEAEVTGTNLKVFYSVWKVKASRIESKVCIIEQWPKKTCVGVEDYGQITTEKVNALFQVVTNLPDESFLVIVRHSSRQPGIPLDDIRIFKDGCPKLNCENGRIGDFQAESLEDLSKTSDSSAWANLQLLDISRSCALAVVECHFDSFRSITNLLDQIDSNYLKLTSSMVIMDSVFDEITTKAASWKLTMRPKKWAPVFSMTGVIQSSIQPLLVTPTINILKVDMCVGEFASSAGFTCDIKIELVDPEKYSFHFLSLDSYMTPSKTSYELKKGTNLVSLHGFSPLSRLRSRAKISGTQIEFAISGDLERDVGIKTGHSNILVSPVNLTWEDRGGSLSELLRSTAGVGSGLFGIFGSVYTYLSIGLCVVGFLVFLYFIPSIISILRVVKTATTFDVESQVDVEEKDSTLKKLKKLAKQVKKMPNGKRS